MIDRSTLSNWVSAMPYGRRGGLHPGAEADRIGEEEVAGLLSETLEEEKR
jgi:hypothetical protein